MMYALALLFVALIVLGLAAATPSGRVVERRDYIAQDPANHNPRSPYRSITVKGADVHSTKARLRREGHTIVSSAPTAGGYTLHYAPNTLFVGRPNGR